LAKKRGGKNLTLLIGRDDHGDTRGDWVSEEAGHDRRQICRLCDGVKKRSGTVVKRKGNHHQKEKRITPNQSRLKKMSCRESNRAKEAGTVNSPTLKTKAEADLPRQKTEVRTAKLTGSLMGNNQDEQRPSEVKDRSFPRPGKLFFVSTGRQKLGAHRRTGAEKTSSRQQHRDRIGGWINCEQKEKKKSDYLRKLRPVGQGGNKKTQTIKDFRRGKSHRGKPVCRWSGDLGKERQGNGG